MLSIHYFKEDLEFNLPSEASITTWILESIAQEQKNLSYINYIFCSDSYLLQINIDHLQHDYLTDIITFDNSDNPLQIEADIFISVDRVKENASQFADSDFIYELCRVMIHGVLHLCGYKDKSESDKNKMRHRENHHLDRLNFSNL